MNNEQVQTEEEFHLDIVKGIADKTGLGEEVVLSVLNAEEEFLIEHDLIIFPEEECECISQSEVTVTADKINMNVSKGVNG